MSMSVSMRFVHQQGICKTGIVFFCCCLNIFVPSATVCSTTCRYNDDKPFWYFRSVCHSVLHYLPIQRWQTIMIFSFRLPLCAPLPADTTMTNHSDIFVPSATVCSTTCRYNDDKPLWYFRSVCHWCSTTCRYNDDKPFWYFRSVCHSVLHYLPIQRWQTILIFSTFPFG